MAPPDGLPPLRPDLRLHDGPPLDNGAPTWTIHDPVRGRYFRIGRLEVALLRRWDAVGIEALVARVNRETPLAVRPEEVAALIDFLERHQLVAPQDPGARRRLAAAALRPGVPWWRRLLQRYLFFRIPLAHPDRFLDATLPVVRPLAGRFGRRLLVLAAVAAVLLTVRRWEAFTHTFLYFHSAAGVAWYAGALVLAKLVHELGHAYAARHHGVAVPTLGVAFIVLWPVFYTDNSDAWQVADRRSRMAMVAAGVLAELALATVATLLWHVLPDGPARSACFVLATVTWVGSVFINLSPFMRFDGYYLLSDYLDIPNLQPRSFALGRWFLRRTLLGLDAPAPEPFAPRLRRLLVGYALTTWLYRLVVFTAIALAVYHFFFKLLGLALFVVEMHWFVVRPVAGELRAWWRRRRRIGLNPRLVAVAALCAALAALAVVPRPGALRLPAQLVPAARVGVYAPTGARIERVLVEEGQRLAAGTPLFELVRPEIDFQRRQVRRRIATLELRLERMLGRRELVEQYGVTASALAEALAEEAGLSAERDRLTLRAPTTGRVVDLADGLRPGRWVGPDLRLARLVDDRQPCIEAFVPEQDLERVRAKASGRFYAAGDPGPPLACRVVAMDPAGLERLDSPYLASTYAGPLAVHPDGTELRLRDNVYRLRLALSAAAVPTGRVQVGSVHLDAPPAVPLIRFARRVAAVFVRESGF